MMRGQTQIMIRYSLLV